MDRTGTDLGQCSDHLRHRLQEPIAIARSQWSAGVHHGFEFVVAQADR